MKRLRFCYACLASLDAQSEKKSTNNNCIENLCKPKLEFGLKARVARLGKFSPIGCFFTLGIGQFR
jgi:hypothetical protein